MTAFCSLLKVMGNRMQERQTDTIQFRSWTDISIHGSVWSPWQKHPHATWAPWQALSIHRDSRHRAGVGQPGQCGLHSEGAMSPQLLPICAVMKHQLGVPLHDQLDATLPYPHGPFCTANQARLLWNPTEWAEEKPCWLSSGTGMAKYSSGYGKDGCISTVLLNSN